MISRIIPALILFFCTFFCVAQDENLLKANTIPQTLIANANAVVRSDVERFEFISNDKLRRNQHRTITVLNERGLSDINAYVSYDNSLTINSLKAVIYDRDGNELRKFKKSDFEDVSSVSDFSLYEDSRVKYLNYTPIDYPFTVVFSCETTSSNTAYLPSWKPLESYYISTEESKFEIIYDPAIGLNIKESNFDGYNIENKSVDGRLSYHASGLDAIKWEAYSPVFKDFAPRLYVNPKSFYYEGYQGEISDWKSLGKWMYDELLANRSEVSENTKKEILELVRSIDQPLEKAKLVYKYVQDRTRYISVQEGIGGIQPIPALKVDEVKYGDCKGLTNYTKALMDIVGVKSYYARVFGSQNDIVDVDSSFVSFVGQTNHVILNIPNNEEDIWLECTSQTVPFGYIAGFTDDRDVFVITPEGGRIAHTKMYPTESNLQSTSAKVTLGADGQIFGDVIIESTGYQYTFHEELERKSDKDKKLYYKDYWDNINNLLINNMSLENDRDNIVYREKVKVSATNYASRSGSRLLLQPNMFNKVSDIPSRYSERKQDFEIQRGFVDKDEFIIKIDPKLKIEVLPDPISIDNKFGTYSAKIEKISEDELKYSRTYILKKGYYKKEGYNEFRTFKRNVVKHDKAKMVLISKT